MLEYGNTPGYWRIRVSRFKSKANPEVPDKIECCFIFNCHWEPKHGFLEDRNNTSFICQAGKNVFCFKMKIPLCVSFVDFLCSLSVI